MNDYSDVISYNLLNNALQIDNPNSKRQIETFQTKQHYRNVIGQYGMGRNFIIRLSSKVNVVLCACKMTTHSNQISH